MKKNKNIIITICVVIVIVIAVIALVRSASFSRSIKSLTSDLGRGLNRTVTVYDYNGNEIKSWSGKFDVSQSEYEVYFDDKDGKRVIIHGGIVINEEE